MSNQALTWAYGLYLGSAPQKAVLLYLADRAREDGTCAWPSVMHISIVTELSVSSVKTALRKLRERGLIVPGDQRHAALGRNNTIIPRNRRSKVWDLRLNIPIESFEDVESAEEVERRLREEKREKERAGKDEFAGPATDPEPENHAESLGCRRCTPEDKADESLGCRRCTPENKADETLGCRRCTSRGAGGVPKPKSITHYPSAPTGHLPASGETPTAETESETTDVGAEWERVGAALADRFELMRSKLGLPSAMRARQDENAMCRLARHVARSNGDDDPAKALLTIGMVIDWMPANRYWLSRAVRCRDFAKHWTGIANDCAVDRLTASQRRDAEARDRDKPGNRPAHRHTWKCEHVLALLGRDETTADPDLLAMRTASQLNAGTKAV